MTFQDERIPARGYASLSSDPLTSTQHLAGAQTKWASHLDASKNLLAKAARTVP